MRQKLCLFSGVAAVLLIATVGVSAQRAPKFNFASQSRFIPKDLGRVYIGMPLKDFVKQIDVSAADIEDSRLTEIRLYIPFAKGNVTALSVQIAGFPVEGRDEMLSDAKAKRKGDDGEEYEINVKRIRLDKIPSTAFVYVYSISFKPEFDQKAYVAGLYGKGMVRDPKDEFHFSDIEWVKRSADGLQWLIRSMHENGARRLTLYGRVKGTEWGLDDIDN
jgi:hypothetical protein